MTQLVILAAGKGSRLGDPETPKPLTLLENGKSLLEMQLETLSKLIARERILVVVGFHKEKFMERHSDLHYVYNPDYASENTSKSLLRALQIIEEDLLWINGDVLLHPSIFPKLVAFNRTAMLVNVGPVAEEEVKYQTDREGRITAVSKEIVDAKGEALGVNFFKGADLPALKEGLERCAAHDYFEKGIEWAIQNGTDVYSFPVKTEFCTEIDFPEDLVRANAMLREWKL
jgi:choline kinase